MNKKHSRREALRWIALTTTAFLAACQNRFSPTPTASPIVQPTQTSTNIPESTVTQKPPNTPESTVTTQPEIQPPTNTPEVKNLATVYMTTAISADGMMKIYEALGRKANGNVAVKISSGEPGGHYFLSPDLIARMESRNGIHTLEHGEVIGLGSRQYSLINIDM